MKSVVDILSELVAIPSSSSADNTPVINVISDWFEDYEKTIQEWERADKVPGKNLIVKIPGEDFSQSLVFACHMDTVPTSSEWETDPYTISQKNGKLYGLGSCDVKGGTAALIHAVLHLKKKPAVTTYIVFSGDEEVACTGIKRFKKEMDLPDPSFIFVEPTDKKIMISQRGLVGMKITTKGQAQHASYATPEENKKSSAIYIMSKILDTLIDDAEKMSHEKDELLGSNTQNLGVIEGGTARNVMPQSCSISFDKRLLPTHNPQDEITRLSDLAKSTHEDIEISDTEILPSFSTNKDARLSQLTLKILKERFSEANYGGFQGWSEAGLFAEYENVVVLGPGSIAQAHQANEYIDANELEEFSHIFKQLIVEKM